MLSTSLKRLNQKNGISMNEQEQQLYNELFEISARAERRQHEAKVLLEQIDELRKAAARDQQRINEIEQKIRDLRGSTVFAAPLKE